jgi:hypothetical protein
MKWIVRGSEVRIRGKWKCLWCSKELQDESFMDLVMSSTDKIEPRHAWQNNALVDEETERNYSYNIDIRNKRLIS